MNPKMSASDMRSPFKALPNTGARPGYPPTQMRFIKCIITKVHVDLNGTPNFVFDVQAMSDGASSGTDDGGIVNVPMLQAGFGTITDVGRVPGGIVYCPEVGSLVMCTFMGSRWYITGFFTGPSKGAYTRTLDKEQLLVDFNSGFEYGLNRLIAPANKDIPWLYGMTPGDVILSKDYSRVKICDRGVIIAGGGTASLIALKTDGERLDRYSSYEARGIGYWERLNFTQGDEKAAAQNAQDSSLASAPDGGASYYCEVMETSPYIGANAPYLVTEKGHISRQFVQRGRSAIYASTTTTTIQEENENDNYAVMRVFIAQPIEKQPSPTDPNISERTTAAQAEELKKAAYEQFDLQIDVDGSFRTRAGNTSELPNGQDVPPTKEMDFSLEYTAKKLALLMRIGKAGTSRTNILADPDHFFLHSPNLICKLDATVDVTAKKSIKFTTKDFKIVASSVTVEAPTEITKELTVKEDITAEKNVDVIEDVNAGRKVTSKAKMVSPAYIRGRSQGQSLDADPNNVNQPAAPQNTVPPQAASCRT